MNSSVTGNEESEAVLRVAQFRDCIVSRYKEMPSTLAYMTVKRHSNDRFREFPPIRTGYV